MEPLMDTPFHNPSYSSASTVIMQDEILHIAFHVLTYVWKVLS